MKKSTLKGLSFMFIVSCVLVFIFFQVIAGTIIPEGDISELLITYPGNGTVFPPEIPSPTFLWEEKNLKVSTWLINVKVNGNEEIVSESVQYQMWKPTPEQWKKIKINSYDNAAVITIIGTDHEEEGRMLSCDSVHIQTSRDSVGASIFYRDVPLPFSYAYKNLDMIRWRLGEVSSVKPATVVLEKIAVCGNCHSFTRDGHTIAMDIDYGNDKGSYIISKIKKQTVFSPDKIITWNDYMKEDEEYTFGLLSQISPDGRYVLSTVKDRSIFVPIDDNLSYSQLFFPIKGVLAVYDRRSKKFWSLPGADDKSFVQSNPNWSPDGKYLVFARSKVYHSEKIEKTSSIVLNTEVASEFIEGRQGFQFDLYRIQFNKGKGGKAEPIPGASNNGMSNYFPRISPDGKWIVFTKARNFMLLQPDSKLYIIPAEGGVAREMNCNTPNMNSWHSWSPNGKWLVFSSKLFGSYTRLLLTHIDEDGNDSPPVFLEYLIIGNRAANIPEFVNIRAVELDSIIDNFSHSEDYYNIQLHKSTILFLNMVIQLNAKDYESLFARGKIKYELNDFTSANQDFQKVVKILDKEILRNPNDYDTYILRADVNTWLKRFSSAIEDYNKAIQIHPNSIDAYVNRAVVKTEIGDFSGAIADYNIAIQLAPGNADFYMFRAAAKKEVDDLKGAIKDYSKVISLLPDYFEAYNLRGMLEFELYQFKEAIADFSKSLEVHKEKEMSIDDYIIAKIYTTKGISENNLGLFQEAINDFDAAIELDNRNIIHYTNRADAKIKLGLIREAIEDCNFAIRINPGYKKAYQLRMEAQKELNDRIY